MKHIVVIIDGTWISAADENTPFSNAYNLNWMLDSKAADGNSQIVFYSSGIGTDEGAEAYFAGATAQGIDNQVREAYINICSNFRHSDDASQPDKIYLFGFSRGAVVARALCGIISGFGVLKPQFMDLFPALWKRFTEADPKSYRPLGPNIAHQDVPVEFIGLFDCVFGTRGNRGIYYTLRFSDFAVPRNVKNAVHLLSLDDERKAFAPMLWDAVAEDNPLDTILEQIWMPGVHSDVGGTYKSNALGRLSLFSMIDLVQQRTALGFHAKSIDRMKKNVTRPVEVNREKSWIWKLMFPGRYTRVCDPASEHQYLHPVTSNVILKYKGKGLDKYRSFAQRYSELKEYPGFKTKNWVDLLYPPDDIEGI